MATPVVVVPVATAVRLLSNRHAPNVITNVGQTVCYLDDAASVLPASNDFTLRPGNSVTWQRDIPCWAIAGAAGAATVNLTDNIRLT